MVAITACSLALLTSCNGTEKKQTSSKDTNTSTTMNTNNNSFEALFEPVPPADFRKQLSTLMLREDHAVITAGTASQFNSMAASWEALGHYFEKPMTLSLLGAGRYTLEFIKQERKYTMSFFPNQHKGDVMAFGSRSGRNSDKMKETKLSYIQTPAGNITYKESSVVIECQLFEVTTVHPDDFYTEDGKKFVEDALKDASDYHKLMFGAVTNIWVKK